MTIMPSDTRLPEQAKKLFLSYARADDEPFVKRLHSDLIMPGRGFSVWFDRVDLPSRGLEFTEEIARAINGADRLLLVMGPGARESKYVHAEWEYALKACKVVNVLLRKGSFDLLEELPFAKIDARDFRDDGNYSIALEKLITQLSQPDALLGEVIPTNNVPPATDFWFVDRPELALLCTDLRASSADPTIEAARRGVFVVQGMAGIGKTTLASLAAQECSVRRRYPDGVFWCELGKEPSIASIQASIGVHFGDDPGNYPDPERGKVSLSQILRDKNILIILDDLWETEHVDAFSLNSSGVKLLLTARGERIATIISAYSCELGTFTDEQGLTLIERRLGLKDGSSNPYRDVHLDIVRFLERHPQAIGITAAQLDRRGPNSAPTILDHLKLGNVFDLLKLPREENRQHNLEVSLKLSYDDLGGKESARKFELQQRFRFLGIFALGSSFDVMIAAAIWGDSDIFRTEEFLLELSEAALVSRTETSFQASGIHYRQHSLLHSYAQALLEKQGEAEIAFDRYMSYLIGIGIQMMQFRPETWQQFSGNYVHFSEVADRLSERFEKKPELTNVTFRENSDEYFFVQNAKMFLSGVAHYVVATGQVNRIKWLELGSLIAHRQGDTRSESVFQNNLALLYSLMGNEKAIEIMKSLVDWGRQVGASVDWVATYLGNLAVFYTDAGDFQKAIDHAQESLSLSQESGSKIQQARMLNTLGSIYGRLGDYSKALKLCELAQVLCVEVGDKLLEGIILNVIGLINLRQGQTDVALSYLAKSLEISQMVNDAPTQGKTLTLLAEAFVTKHQWDKVVEVDLQGIEICENAGLVMEEATLRFSLAIAYRELADLDKSLSELETIKSILEKHQIVQTPSNLTISTVDQEIQATHNFMQKLASYHLSTADIEKLITDILLSRRVGHTDDQAAWKERLQTAYVRATKTKNEHAAGLFNALLSIWNDQPVSLNENNLYREYIVRLISVFRDSGDYHHPTPETLISSGPKLSQSEIDMVIKNTFAVKTTMPEKFDEWRSEIAHGGLGAQFRNEREEWAFFAAIGCILYDQPVDLADDNPYKPHVNNLLEKLATAFKQENLQPEFIEALLQSTFAVKTDRREKKDKWQANLQKLRADFVSKGTGWRTEVEFVDALLAILDDKPATLSDDSQYRPYIDAIIEAIENYRPGFFNRVFGTKRK